MIYFHSPEGTTKLLSNYATMLCLTVQQLWRSLSSAVSILHQWHIFMSPQAVWHRLLCFRYVLFFRCLSRCADVPWQHGLIRSAGKSFTYMQSRRRHMTMHGLYLCSLCYDHAAVCSPPFHKPLSPSVDKPLMSVTHGSATPDLWLPSQPKLVLILPTHRGMARLIWPWWLVTYRDSLPARRWSPIKALTGPSVE